MAVARRNRRYPNRTGFASAGGDDEDGAGGSRERLGTSESESGKTAT